MIVWEMDKNRLVLDPMEIFGGGGQMAMHSFSDSCFGATFGTIFRFFKV